MSEKAIANMDIYLDARGISLRIGYAGGGNIGWGSQGLMMITYSYFVYMVHSSK